MAPITQTSVLETELEPALLEQAFERFNEASKRLEERYGDLLQETELLRAQVREKDLQIKRAEKLAALGETAAGIAHEVRNPLGAMRLFVSALRRDLENRPESLRILSFLDQNISTIDHVVSNILQFSKRSSGATAPMNINSIIREQVEHFSISPHSSRIALELADDSFLMGNEHALRQVLYNVLMNAQQATRYRGEILVRTFASADQSLHIQIKDNGPGIDEAVRSRIFEPFVTTKNEGTGLGLAVVRQIVEEHHGTISATNDGGACITLTFPRAGIPRKDRAI